MNLKTLSEAYIEATEWNMATLEDLLMRKGSSQSSIRRQTSICSKMLTTCLMMGPEVEIPRMALRTKQLLEAARTSGKTLAELLRAHAEWRA